MRRALKVSAWVVGSIVMLFMVLGGAVWVVGNTDSGRGLIERLTYRLSAGHVKLSSLAGSFPVQLTLGELQLSDGRGVWLTADHLSLRWSPLKLLERRIQVDELEVALVHMERAPVGDGKGGTVSIPHIDVGRFSIGAVELGAPLAGTAVTLSAAGNLQLRSLQDANADAVVRRLGGDGEYTLHLRVDPKRMDASLMIHEPAGGPLENLLSLPGLGALSATVTLAGPRNAERIDAVLQAGDLQGRVQGSVDLTHEAADLEYSLNAPAMAPRPGISWDRIALEGAWHGSLATATADGQLDADGLRIAGSTQILRLHAGLSASAGKLTVHGTVNGLVIPGPQPRFLVKDSLIIDASLLMNQPSRPLELTATHRLFTLHAHADTEAVNTGQQRAVVELNLPDVAPFAALAAQDVRGNAAINAQLTHGRSDDSLTLDANVGLKGGTADWIRILGPRVALNLSGSLSDTGVKLQKLRVAGNSLTLAASGSAARTAPVASGKPDPRGPAAAFLKDLQARWQLDVSDLSVLSSDVAGDLKMTGQVSGSPTSMVADADLTSRLSVRGSASGIVEATVHARGLPKAPSGTIQAHGTIDGAPLNVDVAVDRRADDAFRVLVRKADWKSAHVEGDLTANAALTKSEGQLRGRVGQLEDLNPLLGTSVAGSLEASMGFSPAHGRTQARLELDGRNLVVGQVAGDAHLQATGVPNALELQLSAQLPKLQGTPAKLSAAAVLNIDSRELRVASVSLGYRGETFKLLAPAQLSFAKGLSVDELKIGVQDAVFDLKGQLAPTLDLHASVLHVNPTLVNVFAPDLLASGVFEAHARLEGSPSSPTGSVRFDASDVRFADDAAIGLPAVDIRARAQLSADTASIKATLSAGPGSQITASGTAPLNANGALDMKVGGKFDVGLANPLLEARGLRAGGQLSIDATVTGSTTAPQVGGGITLAQGSVRDYVRGVNLSDINAEVVGDAGGLEIKSFNATAVSGTVTMTGSFGVLQPGMPVDLKIIAKNAQPVASSIVTANLDADLHLHGKARERIDVGGTIHVNRATIGIPNSLPPDVAVLDVRRRGATAPVAAEKQLVIGIDVAINAPQQILVQGRGLDAEMGGEIKLSGTSAEPQSSGEFDLLRGSFTLAGNKLDFQQGSKVSFGGAGLRKKIDPTLEFTAQTTLADGTTAYLHITGVADAPRFELSSSSGLPQDQIMEQLLFGKPASQLTAFELAEAGYALATLSGVGGGGSNPLTRLQKTLGLDRLSVGANTTTTATGATQNSGAAIAAGRYVSKRVYVEGKQTTAGTSQVQVDVDLTKHLKLQTRLGNSTAVTQGTTPENDPGSSIGLQYQFEY
jgi:translocation and assembly module TamB